ncbi:MAG: AAA family ATPase [Bacteroidota bacterium]
MAKNKSSSFSKYKFRALKTYASNEWLAESKKKYRKVFDQSEVSVIYAELSFYNKRFDQEDWETEITLKVFKSPDIRDKGAAPSASSQQIFEDLILPVHVSKDQHEVYIREGLGDDKSGNSWPEGTFYWEAYLDGEYLASEKFYIYDVGRVNPLDNPYFELNSVKLYEGPKKNVPKEERIYFSDFFFQDTRFIWIEFISENNLARPWIAEITFNFYNSTRQLKGQTVELIHVKRKQKVIESTWGWGSDYRGTWFPDNYTVEIVFMDTLIAVLPFRVGNHFLEGIPPLLKPNANDILPLLPPIPDVEKLSIEEVLHDLDSLVGLEEIKSRIKEYAQYLKFLKLRKEKGLEEHFPLQLHALFTGNPGTGKTTVARMLGKIYKKLGLLSKGHVHEVDRADIVGEYIGQTAPKVRTAIEKARGGILFIDEAYSLARSEEDQKDYGREVIEMLVKEMSDGEGDLAIIVAGYPREMDIFMKSNPGLQSRFKLHMNFPDYSPEELSEIAIRGAKERNVWLTNESKTYLSQKLTEAYRSRDRSFGHARYVLSIVEEAKLHLGLRIMRSHKPEEKDPEQLSCIQIKDMKAVFRAQESPSIQFPLDEELLVQSMNELNALVGLEEVKNSIKELVQLVKFYRESGKDVLNSFSLHTVFSGNPGTGKTTVARILGSIYKALGILERGNVFECDRQQLVAGYSGQTASKTDLLIEKARGSVLFIDEAYTLIQGPQDNFGHEAVEILLKRMEDYRGELIVVAAGYPDRMQTFLKSNPGLQSRFDRRLEFEDYQPEQLLLIAKNMLEESNLSPTSGATKKLSEYFQYIYKNKSQTFGNARAVRKIIAKAINNQHLRLSAVDPSKRTKKMLGTLTAKDVEEFKPGRDNLLEDHSGSRIGF